MLGVAAIDGGAGNDTITGSSGNDVIIGGAGDDTLGGVEGSADDLGDGSAVGNSYDGGAGVDILRGTDLADTYLFGRGSDIDIIRDNGGSEFDDSVIFGDTISRGQVWFSQNGDDLFIDLVGSDDQLVVDDWFAGVESQVEEFVTSTGDVLLNSQVQQLVNAMAAFAPPTGSGLSLPTAVADSIDPVIAVAWV